MIKTEEIHQGGFYIFESRVSANSNYIENIKEAKQLLIYARYYLKSYLIIHDYIITKDGWQFAVEINMQQQFEEASEDWDTNIELIISERIRLWLSTYVKRINYWRNRKGVLVRDNYRRYYFETLDAATIHLNKMRKQKVKLYQKNKKYRGLKSHYKIDKVNENGSIFLCSKELADKGREVMREVGSQLFGGFQNVVGGKLVDFTLKRHFSTNQTHTKPNSS